MSGKQYCLLNLDVKNKIEGNLMNNDFWACDFIKYDKEELNRFDFSDNTKQYFIQNGLPKNHSIFESKKIKFFNANDFVEKSYKEDKYIVIGESKGSSICIKNSSQEVVAISNNIDTHVFYINSSIKYFILFHEIFYTTLKNVKNINDDNECKKFGKNIRKLFENIDQKAILDKESSWSVMVEQYETCSI